MFILRSVGVRSVAAYVIPGVVLWAGILLAGVHPTIAGVILGVVLGLVVGKLVGVLAASALTVRLGLAARPRGVTWRGVALVGVVAGIGFTMAIFIANLAFPPGAMLGAAKIGVLIASAISGVSALVAGRFLLPPMLVDDLVAKTAAEAEASTEL